MKSNFITKVLYITFITLFSPLEFSIASNSTFIAHYPSICSIENTSVSALKNKILDSPNNGLLRYRLGRKYLSKNNGNAALTQFKKANTLGFIHDEHELDIAESYYLVNNFNTTLEITNAYLDNIPNNSESRIRALFLKGKSELKLPHYNASITIDTFIKILKELENYDHKDSLCGTDNNPEIKWKTELKDLKSEYIIVRQASERVLCNSVLQNDDSNLFASYFDFSKLGKGKTIYVGPTRKIKFPSKASAKAKDGDVILIDAADYNGDVTIWKQNNLTIRSNKGVVKLNAQGKSAGGKGIWVTKGNNVYIEGIEFFNAQSKSKNGSGIRAQGGNLYIKNCSFYDNQMGILTSHNSTSSIIIESSVFYRNTVDHDKHNRLGHNIYVGRVGNFILLNSYSHSANFGHLVKTRAHNNFILANYISDGEKGMSSYAIDIPQGGNALILGNIIEQSAFSRNQSMVSFSAEKKKHDTQNLKVLNNTLINNYVDGIFINNNSELASATVINNVFYGVPGIRLKGKGILENNYSNNEPGFIDTASRKYQLLPASPLIDQGINLDSLLENSLPLFEYNYPKEKKYRKKIYNIDIGAYEYCTQ